MNPGDGERLSSLFCVGCFRVFLLPENQTDVRIYVFEHFGKKHPCLITTLVGCGAYIGIAIASLVASQIPSTGETWRFVFLGCSVFGVIVFILRRYLIETPPFLAYQEKHLAPIPLQQIIKTHWAALHPNHYDLWGWRGSLPFLPRLSGDIFIKSFGASPVKRGVSLYVFFSQAFTF